MDNLSISGRSSITSSRNRSKPKKLGVNFSQRTRKNKTNKSAVQNSKDSRASTTDLNYPSEPIKTGNPYLSTEDVLQRLSRSLPPAEIHSDHEPVKETLSSIVVMQPDFANKSMGGGGHMFVRRLDDAACKIQQQWRVYKQRKRHTSAYHDLDEIKISAEVKKMLEVEREKMKKEKEESRKKKVISDDKKRQARLNAIEELNKKREEKRVLQQKLIEEELKLATEKVTKKKKKMRELVKPKEAGYCNIEEISKLKSSPLPFSNQFEVINKSNNLDSPKKDASYVDLIDEIFSSSRNANDTTESELSTPRVAWATNRLPHVSNPSASSELHDSTEGSSLRKPPTNRAIKEDVQEEKEEKRAYNSLMETLKMLEAETDQALVETKSSSIIIPPTPKLTQGEVYKLDSLGASELHTNGVMGTGKIRNLLDFIDNIDSNPPTEVDIQSCSSSIRVTSSEQTRLKNASAAVEEITENVKFTQDKLDKKEHQLEVLKSELCSTSSKSAQLEAKIYATKLEADEKGKAVLMLQRALDEQRDLTLRLTNEQEKDAQQRLANQKTEYETTIQRHLGFIDQLIADKKQLSEKVESLVSQLKSTEKQLGGKVKLLEDNQRVELKKQKDALEATEKLRRERWINEKSNQIKEMTVKGLEPEIQKLIAKNKSEVKRLKAVHEAELLEADERASKRFVVQVEELREQFAREKESACAREREYAQKRYEKQMEQEEQAYQQQRRRLYAEIQEEKDRVADSLNKQRAIIAGEKSVLEEEYQEKIHKMQAEHKLEQERLENEHGNILRDLKLRIEVEKEQWLEHQKQKQASELLSKERSIREQLKAERDKEIELVVTKLEEANSLQEEETIAGMECRMKRFKDKYESQIADLEHINNTTQAKLNAMKERLTDLEAENIRSRGNIKRLERENEDIQKVADRLKSEREKVETIIREEFAERLVILEEESKTSKAHLIEAKTRHRLDEEKMRKAHETEMEEVQARITSAFAKRDDVILDLRNKAESATSRADHLESLLIKQREELLRPKKA